MNLIRTVFKNITSLVVIEVVNQVSLLILAIILPIYLGDAGFGQYSFVMSFTLLISIFLDLGLRSLTIREVSRNEGLSGKYLSNIALFKVLLSLITFTTVFSLANLANYPPDIKISLYLMSGSLILNSFSDMFRSIFYAYQKMEYGAITITLGRILMTFLVIIFIYWGYGLVQVFLAFLLGNLFAFILNYKIYQDNFPKNESKFELKFLKSILIKALPFGLAIAFNNVFFNFDIVIISNYLNSMITGWYALPVYILTILVTFFYTLSSAVFPALSKFYTSSKTLLEKTYQKTFRYLLIILIPIPPILYLLSDPLIQGIFGNQFYNSIAIFQILIWLLIPISLARFFEVMLASINRQKVVTSILGIFALINIVGDLILIPQIGYMGAIISTGLSQIGVFILDLIFISKLYKTNIKGFGLKMLLIFMIMIFLIYLMHNLNPILATLIISVIYIILVVIMKCFTKEDLEMIKNIFKKQD